MSILTDSSYEKIHTGSAIEVQQLKAILDEKNVFNIVHDDNESAKLAGYALGSPDQSRLLVKKEDVIKAKHLVSNTLENFDQNQISNEELDRLAQEDSKEETTITYTTNTVNNPQKKPEISKGRALFYVAFIIFSLWRLSPLLNGEELHISRIIISSGFIIFSIVMLVRFFKQQSVQKSSK